MQPDKSKLLGTKPLRQPKAHVKSSRSTEQLLKIPGVEGVGTGHGGRMIVYVSRGGLQPTLEKKLGGQDFDVQFTGVISTR